MKSLLNSVLSKGNKSYRFPTYGDRKGHFTKLIKPYVANGNTCIVS